MASEKIAPHDLDAEEAVLGSLLIDPEAASKVSFLCREDFYREKNQWTYECCLRLMERKEPINQVSVAHELAKRQQLEAAGGAAYLSHLVAQVPTSVHAEHYGRIVKSCSLMRQLIQGANQIAGLGYDGDEPSEAIAKSQEILSRLSQGLATDKVLTPSVYADRLHRRVVMLRDRQVVCIPTGFEQLDLLTGGGLYGGEYVVLAARPMMGKSTLLRQMAANVGRQANVLFAQAEMSETETQDRDLATETGRPIKVIRRGGYGDAFLGEINEAVGSIAERKVYRYIDGRVRVSSLRQVAERLHRDVGLAAIFVDYLQILRPEKDDRHLDAYEQTTRISAGLLAIANDLDVPLIVACQLSRKSEDRADRRPRISDLRDSGQIEENADAVFLLYRPDAFSDYEPDEFKSGYHDKHCGPGEAELIVAKHRQSGLTGRVLLQWSKKGQKYVDREG